MLCEDANISLPSGKIVFQKSQVFYVRLAVIKNKIKFTCSVRFTTAPTQRPSTCLESTETFFLGPASNYTLYAKTFLFCLSLFYSSISNVVIGEEIKNDKLRKKIYFVLGSAKLVPTLYSAPKSYEITYACRVRFHRVQLRTVFPTYNTDAIVEFKTYAYKTVSRPPTEITAQKDRCFESATHSKPSAMHLFLFFFRNIMP